MDGRSQLLQAAKRCLTTRGWGATTVRDVAAEAGMSHAAIGYHFGSRDALMTAALVEAVADLERTTGAADASDPRRRWAALLDSVTEHPQLWLAQLEAVRHAQRDPQIRQLLVDGQQQAQRGLGGVLPQAFLVGAAVQLLIDPGARPAIDAQLDELLTAGTFG